VIDYTVNALRWAVHFYVAHHYNHLDRYRKDPEYLSTVQTRVSALLPWIRKNGLSCEEEAVKILIKTPVKRSR